MASQSPPETPEQSIGKGYKYLAAGLRFAGGIVVFLFGGLLLDGWLHTTPLFLVTGTLVGAGLGFLSVYRELMADPANRPTWRGRGAEGRRGGGKRGGQAGRRAGGQRGGGAEGQ